MVTPAKHLLFVVNPNSGVERQKDIRDAIKVHLDTSIFSFDIKNTAYPQHGTLLAREAAAGGVYGVIAVGGDGSVNDIGSGLLGTNTALGILPMGSGNGLARALDISRKLAEALEVINQNHLTAIDAGFANDRPFFSNAGVGFDAFISQAFAKTRKRGFLNYAWLSVKHFFQYREQRYLLQVGNETREEKALLVNVANGRQFGYNFQIAPAASFTDGLLDLVVIRKFPKWQGVLISLRGFQGTLTDSKYVRHQPCRELCLRSRKNLLLQTDGDAWMTGTEVHFRVAPAALKVFTPK